jgi:hypothetical protein
MNTIQESAMPPGCAPAAMSTHVTGVPSQPPAVTRSRYLATLGALFTLFSSARVLAYLPTIGAVMSTGDSSQHSLWTWFTFFGFNVSMAVWLWENNGRRCNGAIVASSSNALMCLTIIAVIAGMRL